MKIRRKMLMATLGLSLLLPAAVPMAADARSEAPPPISAVPDVPSSYNPNVSTAPFAFIGATTNPAIPDGYGRVADTANLTLYINPADSKLIVEDRRSGKLWTSNPLQPVSDQKTILDDAVYQLNYTNARRQMTNLASSASEKPQITIQNIQDGVRVIYAMQKLKITLTIDYAIKDEPRADVPGTVSYLQVTVPSAGLKEEGDCLLATSTTCAKMTSLEVLPMFGAAPNGDQGYLMVPDGMGEIVSFKNETAQYRQRYSAQIYGTDAASQVTFGRGGQNSVSTRPRMPLFGLKDANTAYTGIVTKGEFQANINAYMAGYITNANRASAEFIYRRQASIPRRRTLFVNRIEDDWMKGDRQVRYVLLNGDDANYSGMAKAYRDYLIKSRNLKKLPVEAPRPLLDLFMGITRRSSFRDDMVPMTTFDQAGAIVKAFLDKGLKNFDVQLIGWNADGYRGSWPRRYPAEVTLGGNAGLQQFTALAKQNGLGVYLDDDYSRGYLGSSGGIFGQIPVIRNIWPDWSYGFNSRWDTVRGVNKLPVTFGQPGAWQTYLLNAVVARTNYAERDLPKHKGIGATGVTLEGFGAYISSDTNDRFPLNRDQVAAEYMKIADEGRKIVGSAMVAGANDYIIGHTDRIMESPMISLDAFGDVQVPVYHIATNGLVTRTAWAPNLRNDQRTEFLQELEYDLQPEYMLTHQPSADLIRTEANWLFSSQYTEWVDPAVKEYQQVHDQFGYLNGLFMTNHEILANNVNRVTYEDGSTLLINYNPEPYDGPAGHVDGYGYVLKKGSGRA